MAVRMKRLILGSLAELRVEPSPRRVRAFVGDRTVVDSTRAMLVWEPRGLVPGYAVPAWDIDGQLVPGDPDAADHTTDGQGFTIRLVDHDLVDAAFRPADPDLGGRVLLRFDAFTRWLEEEQQLVGHPHDPFTRIDIVASSRRVSVSLDGILLADSTGPTALFETHLPTRWYLPRDDVRMELLKPSEHRSVCAYKGHASYFSLADGAEAGRDIAWTYPEPLLDATPVRELVCFWAERTDLTVDGVPTARPASPWSTPEDRKGGRGPT